MPIPNKYQHFKATFCGITSKFRITGMKGNLYVIEFVTDGYKPSNAKTNVCKGFFERDIEVIKEDKNTHVIS